MGGMMGWFTMTGHMFTSQWDVSGSKRTCLVMLWSYWQGRSCHFWYMVAHSTSGRAAEQLCTCTSNFFPLHWWDIWAEVIENPRTRKVGYWKGECRVKWKVAELIRKHGEPIIKVIVLSNRTTFHDLQSFFTGLLSSLCASKRSYLVMLHKTASACLSLRCQNPPNCVLSQVSWHFISQLMTKAVFRWNLSVQCQARLRYLYAYVNTFHNQQWCYRSRLHSTATPAPVLPTDSVAIGPEPDRVVCPPHHFCHRILGNEP